MNSNFENLQKHAIEIKKKIEKNKKTPKKDWQRAGSFPPFMIYDDTKIKTDDSTPDITVSKLISILGVQKIPKEMVRRIEEAVHKFYIDSKIYIEAPTESQIEASLLNLLNGFSKGQEEVQKRFSSLDAATKDKLAMVDFPNNIKIINDDTIEPENLLFLIKKALDNISKDPNIRKKSEMPRNKLIYELCDIYHNITGQRPGVTYNKYSETYDGLFFNFTWNILSQTNTEIPSSIGRRISEIVQKYNQSKK
jgi:regulator of sigma D